MRELGRRRGGEGEERELLWTTSREDSGQAALGNGEDAGSVPCEKEESSLSRVLALGTSGTFPCLCFVTLKGVQ